jgi:hypothetical protein
MRFKISNKPFIDANSYFKEFWSFIPLEIVPSLVTYHYCLALN